MRVVFYGGRHFNNVYRLYEAFHTLVTGYGMDQVVLTSEPGGATLLEECAVAAGIDCEVRRPAWLLHGAEAEARFRVRLLDLEPDMVVLLPGGEVDEMRHLCGLRGVSLWDLSQLSFVSLGGVLQLGGDTVKDDAPF